MDTTASPQKTWFDRELAGLLAIFAVIWALIAGGFFFAYPVIVCLNFSPSDPRPICERAEKISLLPNSLQSEIRLKLITANLDQQDSEKTLALIAAEEKASGGSAWLAAQKATVFQRESRIDEASKAYAEVLSFMPDDETSATSLVSLEVQRNSFDAARRIAADFMTRNPSSVWMTSWQGWVEHRAGNHELGLSFYERAISMSPGDAYLHRDVADVKLAMNDRNGAIASMTQAITKEPTNNYYLEKRADIYTSLGELRRAQEDLESSLIITRNATTLVLLGRSYTDTGDFDKALPLFDEALTLDYETNWTMSSKIRMLVRAKQFQQAKTAIAEMRKIYPDDVEASFWDATVMKEEGRLDEALDAFKSLLKIAPFYVDAMTEVGNILVLQDQPKESLPYYTDAIVQGTEAAAAYANRALAHFHMKNWWATVSDANQSIALRPIQGDTFVYRGYAYVELGQIEKAKASMAQAMANAPMDEWVQTQHLEFLMANSFLDDAKVAVERLQSLVPQSPLVAKYQTELRARGVAVP